MFLSKKILITGAGTGIGRDAAFALAARGHQVWATTFDAAQAEALLSDVKAQALPIQVFKLDITCEADRALVVPLELDVLINNAGVGESGALAEVPMDRVRHAFEVNVFATLALTQTVLRGMVARERGTVLLVSSIAGRIPVGAIHTGFNQAMTSRKYAWMDEHSYFWPLRARLKAEEQRSFDFLEARDTRSIVAQIVQAAEARRPRLRYVAPRIQGWLVRLARIFGV